MAKKQKRVDNNNEEEKQHKIIDYRDKYLRALADYQNLEKRVNEQINRVITSANDSLLLSLLEIVDDIEKAEAFIQDEGLQIITTKLQKLLADQNIREIDIEGKIFDPVLAEALTVVEGEKDNVVVEVLRKGYMRGQSVLRPAHVRVSKKLETV